MDIIAFVVVMLVFIAILYLVFFLNEKHLHLCYHPEMNFMNEPFQKPVNQRVKVSRIVWMGAFGSSNNRLHGKMSALTA